MHYLRVLLSNLSCKKVKLFDYMSKKHTFPVLSKTQSSAHSSWSHLPHAQQTQSFPDLFRTSSSYVAKHTQHLLSSISSSSRQARFGGGGGCVLDLVLNVQCGVSLPVAFSFPFPLPPASAVFLVIPFVLEALSASSLWPSLLPSLLVLPLLVFILLSLPFPLFFLFQLFFLPLFFLIQCCSTS